MIGKGGPFVIPYWLHALQADIVNLLPFKLHAMLVYGAMIDEYRFLKAEIKNKQRR